MPIFTSVPDSSNTIELQELSSGFVNDSELPSQSTQQNLFENISKFPKIEPFEINNKADAMPQF